MAEGVRVVHEVDAPDALVGVVHHVVDVAGRARDGEPRADSYCPVRDGEAIRDRGSDGWDVRLACGAGDGGDGRAAGAWAALAGVTGGGGIESVRFPSAEDRETKAGVLSRSGTGQGEAEGAGPLGCARSTPAAC